MRTIRTATFVSIDGVMQAPGGPQEDPSGGFRFGGWNFPWWDEPLEQLMGEAMAGPFDLLLGRRTWEIFAAHWPYQDDEIGRLFNAAAKYVAAGPDTALDWANSHRLEGNVAEAVRALKATDGPDLLIHGSSRLTQTLLAHDLIDQMTLLTFPVVLGRGKRLFDDGSAPHAWEVIRSGVSPKGVIVATYRRGGEVPTGSFAEPQPSQAELDRRRRWAADG